MWWRIRGSLIQIDTDYSRAVWGVNRERHVYKLKKDWKNWRYIGGQLKHVSAGEGGVWGVNGDDQIFYRLGKHNSSIKLKPHV